MATRHILQSVGATQWSFYEGDPGPAESYYMRGLYFRVRAGWPLMSMQGDAYRRVLSDHLHKRWIIPWASGMLANKWLSEDPRLVPFAPLWPGFAINTLFYAGLLWVLFAGPFALRRMIRRRRGQCPACAYPIGQSPVCTECGAAVTQASRGAV